MMARVVDKQFLEDHSEPVPESGCWLWGRCVGDKGYGMIGINGKTQRVHRVSYELHKGEIPKGMCVCHSCDIPSCINPDHLFLGTNQDNVDDREAKGRNNHCKGVGHGCSKLTESDVINIRLHVGTHQEAADEFGVSRQQIGNIKSYKSWAHIQ